jgi:Tfp pilus assembly protein PilX
MPVIKHISGVRAALLAENGVTMIIALLSMLVTSLLLVAAFTAANGDSQLSRADTTQKQAYYAALAGVQEYEYKLEDNPDYWESCPEAKAKVYGEESESYEVTTLPASSAPSTENTCSAASPPSNPFKTLIESKGSLTNTFRVRSIGKAGTSSRSLVATFQVAGFLNYIYFTRYEDQDPDAYKTSANQQKACGEHYRPEREKLEKQYSVSCVNIEFAPEDFVNGPMKTDDKALICNEAEFGRQKHTPYDPIEIDLGVESAGNCGGGGGSPVYNTESKKPTEGAPELVPPESDGSLRSYVEPEDEFTGLTYLELEGSAKKIKVTTFPGGKEEKSTIAWPKNGLIYVQSGASGCGYNEFEQRVTDTTKTKEEEKNCGSVYVKGTYSSSLTIAAEDDLIINNNIEEYGVTPPAAPSGTATLGLIASRYVRIYHPVVETYEAIGSSKNKCKTYTSGYSTKEDVYLGSGKCEYTHTEEVCDAPNASGSLTNPWIYGAILSTTHSFLVDNDNCGEKLSDLNVYGAIAQNYRGIVGTGSTSGTGYTKEYKYDERLATDEPPYFLAPLKAGWHIARLTAASAG